MARWLAFQERTGGNSRLRAIGNAQFFEDERQLILDRTRSDPKTLGDRLIWKTLGQELEDLPLLLTHQGRRRTSRGGRIGRSELTGKLGRYINAPVHDELDRLLQQLRRVSLGHDTRRATRERLLQRRHVFVHRVDEERRRGRRCAESFDECKTVVRAKIQVEEDKVGARTPLKQ